MGGIRVTDDEFFIIRQGKRHRAVERPCEHCQTLFVTLASQRPGTGRFCSLTCARSRKTEDRFWSKVAKSDGCWEWQGSRERSGYGILGASRHHPATRAHRVSWELVNGPVPEGLFVLHHCDNPPCVRPDHLYVGTSADNARDRERRNRGRENRGESNPNVKLTEDDVKAIISAVSAGATQTAVAKRFGVSQPHVSSIVRRKSWGP